jgi:hypothetical protein
MRRRWSHGVTCGIGLGFALAIACKDDGGTGSVPEDDAPQRVAAAVCDAWAACECADFPMFADRFDSDADCRTEMAEEIQDDIDAGNEAMLTYQGACIGLVIDAVAAADCSTAIALALDESLVDAVEDIFTCKLFYGDGGPDLDCIAGTCAIRDQGEAEGAACTGENTQGDCAFGLVCLDLDGNDETTCADLPAAGETCLGTLDLCDLESFCDQADKRCRSLPVAGSACAPFAGLLGTCAPGSICVDEMCEAAPAPGESCTGFCELGSSCDAAGTCRRDPPIVCQQYGVND